MPSLDDAKVDGSITVPQTNLVKTQVNASIPINSTTDLTAQAYSYDYNSRKGIMPVTKGVSVGFKFSL